MNSSYWHQKTEIGSAIVQNQAETEYIHKIGIDLVLISFLLPYPLLPAGPVSCVLGATVKTRHWQCAFIHFPKTCYILYPPLVPPSFLPWLPPHPFRFNITKRGDRPSLWSSNFHWRRVFQRFLTELPNIVSTSYAIHPSHPGFLVCHP